MQYEFKFLPLRLPIYSFTVSHYDFTRSTDFNSMLNGDITSLFSYPYIKNLVNEINSIPEREKANKPRTYFFITNMRVERYYSSVKEETSPLSTDAYTMLDKQDYVGFFQSCGPNYVRSIRRAQEVSAVFKFDSFRQGLAQEFAAILRTSGNGSTFIAKMLNKSKFNPILASLEINVKGYGLALNEQGAGTLVPSSIEDYNEIMKYAYEVMSRHTTGNNNNAGMVYALEVVPWTDNVSFQVASKIQEEGVEVIQPRSLMERAFHNSDKDATWSSYYNDPLQMSDNVTFVRDLWECSKDGYRVDKFGYCCELASMYNTTSRKYGDISASNSRDEELRLKLSQRICRPTRTLEKSIVKNNMSSNGEFVARLDKALRLKLNQISALEKCSSFVKAIPDEQDFNILKPNESSVFDANLEYNFTVKHLKLALDPLGNDEFIKHMNKEFFEYQEMFYRKCLSEMFGGGSSDVEATLFMAKTWSSYDRCQQHSCLQENMRWDRKLPGKCVGSMINGGESPYYPDGGEGTCALNGELDGPREECLYSAQSLSTFHIQSTQCWKNTLPEKYTIFYFMDLFCDPKVTNNVITEEEKQTLTDNAATFCTV